MQENSNSVYECTSNAPVFWYVHAVYGDLGTVSKKEIKANKGNPMTVFNRSFLASKITQNGHLMTTGLNFLFTIIKVNTSH